MRTIDKFSAYDRFAQIIWLRVKPDGIGSRVGSGGLNERVGLRRRTRLLWQDQMGVEYLLPPFLCHNEFSCCMLQNLLGADLTLSQDWRNRKGAGVFM